jgi:cobalt-zinc-cadmium efflux system outer membrane protein
MARVRFNAGVLLVLLQLLFGVAAAWAQDTTALSPVPIGDTLTLSIGEAQSLALRQNPSLLADRQETEIARGQLRQARLYNFNPELAFEAPGVGTAGALGEYEARLTQEVEWAGQRGLRIRAAGVGLDQSEALVRDAARQTLSNVSGAFYEALAAQQRLGVVREILGLNQQLLAATRTQLREGEISALEANLAEIEAGRSRARVLAAERELTSARLELQRLVGIAPAQTVRLAEAVPAAPTVTSLDPDSLIRIALERRPDLAARTRAVEQSQALKRLAAREAIPNLSIGVFAERQALGVLSTPGAPSGATLYESPRVGLALSLPLPLWNRNQGLTAERQARVEQAGLARRATELAVRTQVTDAYRAYRSATEEVQTFERDVLQPARENQRLLDTAFRAGKVGLPTLILLRNQLLDAELGYLDAALAQRRALVGLQAATATLVPTDFELPATSTRNP